MNNLPFCKLTSKKCFGSVQNPGEPFGQHLITRINSFKVKKYSVQL